MPILRPHEIKLAREAGKIAADTLLMVGEQLSPGITTGDIDRLVHEFTLKNNATPATLGYGKAPSRPAFPASCCTSVNQVICHGIPSGSVRLEDGDIVNVDVTPIFPKKRGFHGDTSITFYVGQPSKEAIHVVETARQALEIGLAVVRPGRRIGDIGAAIQTFVESQGCSVVREYTGHGVGRVFHDAPSVPHYGVAGTGPKIRRGMCFTVEPMVNLGSHELDHLDDGWTVVTRDGNLSAQFEHTIVVTKNGCQILTARGGLAMNSEDRSYSKLGPIASAVDAA